MTGAQQLTAESYAELVDGLRGRVIVAVDYCVLGAGEDGTEPGEWDFGTWHEPTMGVDLTMDDGSRYSAVWGNTFDYYGLELEPAPKREPLGDGVPTGGSPRVSATDHALWAGLISTPIESCEILWCGHGAVTPNPEALRLRTATGQVWIAVGRSATYEPDSPFHLCTDDVLVIFDPDTAARAGLEV